MESQILEAQTLQARTIEAIKRKGLEDWHFLPWSSSSSFTSVVHVYDKQTNPDSPVWKSNEKIDTIWEKVKDYKIVSRGDPKPMEVGDFEPPQNEIFLDFGIDAPYYMDYGPDFDIYLPRENTKFLHVCKLHLHNFASREDFHEIIIVYDPKYKKQAEEYMYYMRVLNVQLNKIRKLIRCWGGVDIILKEDYFWPDLVLPDYILSAVKDDLEFWLNRKDFYNKARIPYKRGYLFEGPPGNGKTAIVRVILSQYDFSGFTFNFSNKELGDSDFSNMYSAAIENAPSIVLLEDIDRIFGCKDTYVNVTKEALLNTLDGVAVNTGVVTIATANNPEKIDPAIRKRPGRFDVCVRFSNPEGEQRQKYFLKMFKRDDRCSLTSSAITEVVERTSGMSMAFLKLIYETAHIHALRNNPDGIVRDEDLKFGVDRSLSYYETAKESDRSAGFKSINVVGGEENVCEKEVVTGGMRLTRQIIGRNLRDQ